jgi:hypothetical protein
MKKHLLLSLFSLSFVFSQAHPSMTFSTFKFYYHKNIQKFSPVSKCTLVVQEVNYNKRQLKKFNKKGTLDQNIKALKIQNDLLLSTVKEHWKYNENIISSSTFTDEKEYKKNEKYIYIEVKSTRDTKKVRNSTYTFSYTLVSIRGKKWFNTYSNSGGSLTNLEFVSALHYLQKGFKASDKGVEGKLFPAHVCENASQLKNKTLLIPAGYSTLSIDKIKENYTNKIELVSIDEINKQVLAKSDLYAYYIPQHQNGSCGSGFHHVIYSCANQDPIALIKANTFKVGTHGGNAPLIFELVDLPVSSIPLTKVLRSETIEELNTIVNED